MGIKDVFNSIKKEGIVTKPLDAYLFEKANRPNDRAVNVNAPSQAGNCLRANYYMRMGYETDGGIDPRGQRIFDNGDGVHSRLQNYLLDMHLLITDEVPLINDQYNIQGHTDGYLDLGDEVAILEIKSINDNQFTQLKDAKEHHKLQGMIYMFCAEERRLYLKKKYKTLKDFYASTKERAKYFESHYQHMKGGAKHTREEKIKNEVTLNLISDDVLYRTEKPVETVIFLYENKNTQELKEYKVTRSFAVEGDLDSLLADYEYLNECCEKEELPPRGGTSKSCETCRWCNYKIECYC